MKIEHSMLLGNSCLAVVAGRLEHILRCFLLAAVLVSAPASSAGLERVVIAASQFGLMASPPDLAQAEYWQGRLPIALRRSGVPSVEEYAKVLSNDEFVLEYLLSEGQLKALVEELGVNS